MIAVIFELEPQAGAAPRYFERAAALKAELQAPADSRDTLI